MSAAMATVAARAAPAAAMRGAAAAAVVGRHGANNAAAAAAAPMLKSRRSAPALSHRRRGSSSLVVAAIPDMSSDAAPATTSAPTGPPVELSYDWQLDFCSRPMKDERGKKMWELLICDEKRSFEHAEYFPNNRINSVELAKAIERVVAAQGARPRRFKFFRSQMQTIISRACTEVGIDPLPSRRCQTLTKWLDWRIDNVYKQHPGYDGQTAPMMGFEMSSARPLPDALRGESWAFVALPLVAVREEAMSVSSGRVFGDLLELDPNLPDDTLIPGIAVYTRRAAALAGWTKGLELGGISVDLEMSTIILDTGVADSWQYARFRKTKELNQEAKEWEQVKAAVGGLHFLAIQTDEDAESTDGFWLLQDYTAAKF